jgi:hypothetical protein
VHIYIEREKEMERYLVSKAAGSATLKTRRPVSVVVV